MQRHPGHTLRTLLPAARAAVDAWSARRSNSYRNFAAVRTAMERLGKEVALFAPEETPKAPRPAFPRRIHIRKLFPNTWFLDALAALDAERHGGATWRALAERYGYSTTRLTRVLRKYHRGWQGSGPYWSPYNPARDHWGTPPPQRKQKRPKITVLHQPLRLDTICSACGLPRAPYSPGKKLCAPCITQDTQTH